MRHGKRITLFVPEKLSSSGSLWRRYVISCAVPRLRREECTEGGEVYIFDRHSAAYSASVRCEMPKIFPGCAVLTCADMSDEAEVTSLPEGCLRVLSAERFDSPLSGHLKLCLG